MFYSILSSRDCPSDWSTVNISLLHKKGARDDPANYRGISLIRSIAKIFTAILSRRLATWAESNFKIAEMQSGFRRKRSCTDNIFVLSCHL